MRRGLYIFLVLLLALRGLLGDAMAMGVAPAHPHAPTEAHGTTHARTGHGMVHEAQAAGDDHGPGLHAAIASDTCAPDTPCTDCGQGHGPGCSACGICHSALFHPSLPVVPQAQTRTAPHPPGGTRFASAPAALAIKPPIS